ncbi:hypothetical protein [Streptomyces hoynatensis]|uniref:Uncharacterized protein n=1 Tax=Streptomyces hoynatensis TaxID=1141874 RepID=A0A3A9ZES4_9ACTN|nr:hypothetical protein [Streptomyces hoynatensis]RKN46685.1 hypothetical protein D7294_00150 [Streptomyces hoynatensis]
MEPESNEYSAAFLRPTKWGEITRLDDGRWETVWALSFTAPAPAGETPVHRNDRIGFRSTLRVPDEGDRTAGQLRVVTEEEAMSAVNYPETFTSFRLVHETVAAIRTIQGLPREWYAPFR